MKKMLVRRLPKRLKLLLKKTFKRVFREPHLALAHIMQIILGALINAIATNLLIIPFGILTGGISGISLILNYIFGFPVGLSLLILNIPFFILGKKHINLIFLIQSVLAITLYSILVDLSTPLRTLLLDRGVEFIVAAIFAGSFLGFGTGLVLKGRGSFGGTDILATIIKNYYSISIGTTNLVINLGIMTVSLFLFDLNIVLYSIITIFFISNIADKTLLGFNQKKALFVISDKGKEIAFVMNHKLKIPSTLINATGAFEEREKVIIYTVVSSLRLARIKDTAITIDPNCFITTINVNDITGGKLLKK